MVGQVASSKNWPSPNQARRNIFKSSDNFEINFPLIGIELLHLKKVSGDKSQLSQYVPLGLQ